MIPIPAIVVRKATIKMITNAINVAVCSFLCFVVMGVVVGGARAVDDCFRVDEIVGLDSIFRVMSHADASEVPEAEGRAGVEVSESKFSILGGQ